MKQIKQRLLSVCLALAVLLCMVQPVWAADTTSAIHIYTVQELLQLQSLCTLDTATVGKTIYLENDLDLTGSGFTGLPTLRGTFDGQHHTIRGLELTEKGSVQGFVRYLESDGIVQNLTIDGTIAPSDRKMTLGGVVGCNRGMIRGCAFTGTIVGDSEVGGIVGRNDASGQVINCTNSGTVTAAAMAGGIAGQNLGTIVQCGNGGNINTSEIKTTLDADSIMNFDTNRLADGDSSQFNTSVHDVGGIAGRSAGILQSCNNSGTVGYAHIGYNVGGIVGRQSGYLNGCSNAGSVNGRKDVGGIVGQLEPDLTILYGTDALETLYSELDNLQNLMDSTLVDARNSSSAVTSQMTSLTDTTRQAKENTGDLADSLTNWADKNVSAINSTVAAYAKALNDLKPVLDNAETALSQADAAAAAMDQLLQDGSITAGLTAESIAQAKAAADSFNTALGQAHSAKEHADAALQAAIDALGNDGDTQAAWQQLVTAMQDLIDAANAMQSAAEEIYNILAGITDDPEQQENWQALQEQYARYQDAIEKMEQANAALREELEKENPDYDAVREQAQIYLEQALIAADAVQQMQTIAAAIAEKVAPEIEEQLQILADESANAADAAQRMLDALQQLTEALDPANLPQEFWDELDSAQTDMNDAIASLEQGTEQLRAALEILQKALDSAATLPADAAAVVEPLRQSATTLRSGLGMLQNILTAVVAQPVPSITPIDDSVNQNRDALDSSLTSLITGLASLNATVSVSNDTMMQDFSAINAQLGKVIDAIKALTSSQYNEESLRQHFEDVSADSNVQENGMIVSAANSGSVEGDSSVGGIVGSMAQELDFDPEDDLTEQGRRSSNVKFQISLIVLDCTNNGAVISKKSNVGGIVGTMEYGYLGRCENYADVVSTAGDYVGGLAGLSRGAIHDSWVRCALSGGDYIGGVAGYGKEIANCVTMVAVTEGESCIGALCGNVVEEDATLSNNRIVSESLGAVDGVSYAEQVTPTTFEEIAADTSAPSRFAQLELTFVADGKTIAVVPFRYGSGISSLPELPAKDGCVAQWPAIDYTHLTYSQTIDAEYTPYTSALADNDTVPNILVDGSFSQNAVVSTETAEVSFTDEHGTVHTGTAITVTVTDPVFGMPTCTVHYRKPDTSVRYTVYVRQLDGSWSETAYTKDGSYLLLAADDGTLTFMVEQITMNWTIFAFGMIAAAAILIFALFLLCRNCRFLKVRKPRNK